MVWFVTNIRNSCHHLEEKCDNVSMVNYWRFKIFLWGISHISFLDWGRRCVRRILECWQEWSLNRSRGSKTLGLNDNFLNIYINERLATHFWFSEPVSLFISSALPRIESIGPWSPFVFGACAGLGLKSTSIEPIILVTKDLVSDCVTDLISLIIVKCASHICQWIGWWCLFLGGFWGRMAHRRWYLRGEVDIHRSNHPLSEALSQLGTISSDNLSIPSQFGTRAELW